jgi:hypothetical protein
MPVPDIYPWKLPLEWLWKMRTLRPMLLIVSALVLIGASTMPLLQVIQSFRIYKDAATNQFYTPLAEANAKNHFFDKGTLRLLRPATSYFLLLVLLECGAAYSISVLLSRSTTFNPRRFAMAFCLSAIITTAITTLLWTRVSR